jgi:hypothetical protein
MASSETNEGAAAATIAAGAAFRQQRTAWLGRLDQTEQEVAVRARPYRVPIAAASPGRRVEQGFRCLRAIYAAKTLALCRLLRQSLNQGDPFVYALAGRCILEHFAILIYYGREKIKPMLAPVNGIADLPETEIVALGQVLEQFIDGRRYDWSLLLTAHLPAGLQRPDPKPVQVNILTCIQKWARVAPDVEDLYGMFSDIIHPNAGSLIPLLHVEEDALVIGASEGEPLGQAIMARTGQRLIDLLASMPEALDRLEAAADQAAASPDIATPSKTSCADT